MSIQWEKFTIEKYFEDALKEKQHLRSFYKKMVNFNPDINGYYLTYFVLPDFGGEWIGKGKCPFPTISKLNKTSRIELTSLLAFACVDCSPPNIQVTSDVVNVRTGSMPLATEVFESDTINMSFLDNRNLDVYNFNYEWLLYIKATDDGLVEPSAAVITESDKTYEYGSVDYMGSIYIVKFEPDLTTVSYIGKATGVFPQNAPNKEILGTRNSNSISLVPITYYSSIYREATNYNGEFIYYDPFGENNDMLQELKDDISNNFNDVNVTRNRYNEE